MNIKRPMYRLLALSLIASAFFACSKDEHTSGKQGEDDNTKTTNTNQEAMIPHYILSYEACAFGLNTYIGSDDLIHLDVVHSENNDKCSITDDGYYFFDSDQSGDKFMALARKHGDMSYAGIPKRLSDNKPEDADTWWGDNNPDSAPRPLAYDINAIEIISDADWDATHPAGTSLNDLFAISAKNAYYIITNGYKPYGIPDDGFILYPIDKPVKEIVEGDLWCLWDARSDNGIIRLSTDKHPTEANNHTLTVKLSLDNGKEIIIESNPVEFR